MVNYVLCLLFFFLGKKKRDRWIRSLLLISCLWVYVFVTGFAPATLRAGVMLSILILGQSLERNTNIFNTLAASAFILLMYDPHYITDVGFQLSYLALAGILVLQPMLYKSIYLKYWLPDQAWKLTATSIAAQLYTFPLSLFYFGQFPVYFILSNLIVIPLSTLCIYAGLSVLSTSYIPLLSSLSGKVCGFFILCLDSSVRFFDHLPYSNINNSYISVVSTLFMYLLIIAFSLLCFVKSIRILQFLLVVLIFYAGFTTYGNIQERSRKMLVVYSSRHATAIDFIAGRENVFLVDTVNPDGKASSLGIAGNNWAHSGVAFHTIIYPPDTVRERYMEKKGNFLQFYGRRILIVDKSLFTAEIPGRFAPDYIIVREGASVNLEKALTVLRVRKVIADGSNGQKALERIKKICRDKAVELYPVADRGAFVEEL